MSRAEIDLSELQEISDRHRILKKPPQLGGAGTKEGVKESEVSFSHIEDEELPSYSPRPPETVDPDEVRDRSDKREQRDRLHYLSKHPGKYVTICFYPRYLSPSAKTS